MFEIQGSFGREVASLDNFCVLGVGFSLQIGPWDCGPLEGGFGICEPCPTFKQTEEIQDRAFLSTYRRKLSGNRSYKDILRHTGKKPPAPK